MKVAEVGAGIGVGEGLGDGLLQLGVYQQRHPDVSQDRHRSGEVFTRDVGEVIDAGVAQEALKSHDSSSSHRGKLWSVSRHDPAPEAAVHPELVCCDRELLMEGIEGGGHGGGVQRHVHDGGHPAHSCSLCGGLEAFPRRATGLVDMDMRVDEARHEDGIAEIPGGTTGSVEDCGDARAIQDDSGRSEALRCQDAAAVEGGHGLGSGRGSGDSIVGREETTSDDRLLLGPKPLCHGEAEEHWRLSA